jgi:excisionase family DNA binding protein
MTASELLTTQEVARFLRCSRQHVADLCNAGKLRCVRIGVHRRIQRADLEPLLPAPDLRREELRSLWLHRAVAGKFVLDPNAGAMLARANLERFRALQPRARTWLDEWATLLDRGPDAVLETLTSRSRRAVDLRQNSPFAGLLTEGQRGAVLAAFTATHPPAGVAAQ